MSRGRSAVARGRAFQLPASIFDPEPEATCTECGCTDSCACPDGCSWLAVDYAMGRGVCSSCPSGLKAWNNQKAPTSKSAN